MLGINKHTYELQRPCFRSHREKNDCVDKRNRSWRVGCSGGVFFVDFRPPSPGNRGHATVATVGCTEVHSSSSGSDLRILLRDADSTDMALLEGESGSLSPGLQWMVFAPEATHQ